jgi:hypothetical protein
MEVPAPMPTETMRVIPRDCENRRHAQTRDAALFCTNQAFLLAASSKA